MLVKEHMQEKHKEGESDENWSDQKEEKTKEAALLWMAMAPRYVSPMKKKENICTC